MKMVPSFPPKTTPPESSRLSQEFSRNVGLQAKHSFRQKYKKQANPLFCLGLPFTVQGPSFLQP